MLSAYYRSFAMQNVVPPEGAQNALYDAMELAPSDDDIRYVLARDSSSAEHDPRGDRDHPAGGLSGALPRQRERGRAAGPAGAGSPRPAGRPRVA